MRVIQREISSGQGASQGDAGLLRIGIGEAAGHNWWCVLFPPLCMSAASAGTGSAEDAFVSVGLTKDQYGVITETGKTKYRMRFRILELWEKWFGD